MSTPAKPPARGETGHGRLALVLAEPGVQGIVSEVLRARQFMIRRAVDPAQALARLATDAFDLVVLPDDPAQGLDAGALTRELRRAADCPSRRAWVLALARNVVASDVLRLRNAGVSGLLVGRLSLGRLEERLTIMDHDTRAFIEASG
jgi:DNA-binding response OmpR family regulator